MTATIPAARPRLPDAAHILPYLHEIDANTWYSNFGPLSRRLHARLASHWGLEEAQLSLLANATVGITLALQASGARPGAPCIMPSWTFVASAGAVHAAGLVPHFMDVDPATWALDPAAAAARARAVGAAAILVVAPFGAPLDTAAWDGVQRDTGIPVVIDAAAAFDTLRAGGPMRPGRCPVIVSLHATKVFGIGEGGAVLCRDAAWLERIRCLSNFGFLGSRQANRPGLNGKMSEYAAAVGLAGLDTWRATRARWQRVTHLYRQRLRHSGIVLQPGFGEGWVASTFSVLRPAQPGAVEPDIAGLEAAGVATIRWWGPGCHAQPAFQAAPADPLPVTARLAAAAIGLPFWQDLTPSAIDRVCHALTQAAPARAAAPPPAPAPAPAPAASGSQLLPA